MGTITNASLPSIKGGLDEDVIHSTKRSHPHIISRCHASSADFVPWTEFNFSKPSCCDVSSITRIKPNIAVLINFFQALLWQVPPPAVIPVELIPGHPHKGRGKLLLPEKAHRIDRVCSSGPLTSSCNCFYCPCPALCCNYWPPCFRGAQLPKRRGPGKLCGVLCHIKK